jgi:predicted P-loop ATPase
MFGTTNESTYLRDRTGNRRFWPVPVRNRINIAWLAKWRDQLLAEAYLAWREGAVYTPTPAEEARLFVPMQESRLVETAVLSELLAVLTRDPAAHGIGAVVNNLADFVTMGQLVTALGVDAAKSSPALEAQIRSWMEHEGWERTKRQINGVRAWGYAKPRDWPPPDRDEPAVLNATPQGPGEAAASAQEADDAPF